MFDPVPPNLPVEPLAAKSVASPTSARAPSGLKGPIPTPLSTTGKKEPEDIFSGLKLGEEAAPGSPASDILGESPRKNPLILVGIIVLSMLILAGVGYGVYAFFLVPKTQTETPLVPSPVAPTPQPAVEQPPITAQPEQNPIPVVQAPANIPPPQAIQQPGAETATTEPQFPAPTPAAVAITEGVDSDADLLTDTEEALYGSSPTIGDTDGDGYSDGSETMNLFSPIAKGALLSADTFVMHSTWNGWSFLIPQAWSVTQDPNDPSSASLMTGTLGKFLLTVKANTSHQSLAGWIGSTSVSMKSFKTKPGFEAMMSADGLTTYIAQGDTILIVVYDLGEDRSYEYRTSYAMLLNSFLPAPKP